MLMQLDQVNLTAAEAIELKELNEGEHVILSNQILLVIGLIAVVNHLSTYLIKRDGTDKISKI